MKKALKITAMVLGALLLLLMTGAMIINFKGLPQYPEVVIPDLKVEATPERVERGLKLASMNCFHCHLSENQVLEGKLATKDEGFGTLYAGNITRHPEYGIGKYSDGELYRLLRTGIKRSGEMAIPMMEPNPHTSDEDLYALISYLKSDEKAVQPSSHVLPPQDPSFLAKALTFFVFKPLPYPEKTPVVAPSLEQDSIAYGRYLVQGPIACFSCHSRNFMNVDLMVPENSEGYLGGGNVFVHEGDTLISKDITQGGNLFDWTADQFVEALKWGRNPDGSILREPMPKFSQLSDQEARAIYAYLRTVPKPAPAE